MVAALEQHPEIPSSALITMYKGLEADLWSLPF